MRLLSACVVVALVAASDLQVYAQSATSYGFSTIAGRALISGTADGPGADARFYRPVGIAVDAVGNVYVGDGANHTVRKISAAGVVTTLAGQGGGAGNNDGTGADARFGIIGDQPYYATGPFGVAVDAAGNVFAADGDNHTIRRLTQAGVVTTYAGRAGTVGSTDGLAANALFKVPIGVAVVSGGVVFVADTFNHVIRRISAAGVVSTIAGASGEWGTEDGIGQSARFWHPTAIAADPSGNLYVADSPNTIRKVSPQPGDSWQVTTLAGTPFTAGTNDGVGAGARFGKVQPSTDPSTQYVWYTSISPPGFSPAFRNAGAYTIGDLIGLAADGAGNVYVTDFSNNTIRKISASGAVSTIGGSNNPGSADAVGTVAQFRNPAGIAVDAEGNLYIADFNNHTIRKGSAASAPVIRSQPSSQTVSVGTDVVLAVSATGSPIPTYQWTRNNSAIAGATNATLTLSNIQAAQAGTYAVTVSNSLGIAATQPFTLTVTAVPVITLQPVSQTVSAGDTFRLSASATGSPAPTYQWYRNGEAIPGLTGTSITVVNAQSISAGDYVWVATNSFGSATSNVARVVVNLSRIVNLSIRSSLSGSDPLIVGFVTAGGSKSMLVRAAGPALRGFGVTTAMADPQLSLFAGSTLASSNDNWGTAASAAQVSAVATQVGAFALTASSLDAAMLAEVSGPMTAQASARNGAGGIVLVELYDAAESSAARLTNVSARARVGVGENAVFAGFVIAGTSSKLVLLRAVGPSLAAFGITGALADPQLQVYGVGSTISRGANDNWGGTAALISAFSQVGAFPLPSGTSRDAALITSLPPGAYTAQVTGIGNTTGEVLLEIYELP